jgi:hypothetical protein
MPPGVNEGFGHLEPVGVIAQESETHAAILWRSEVRVQSRKR